MFYAPTHEADEEKKGLFYWQLQEVFRAWKEQELMILMRDFNARWAKTIKAMKAPWVGMAWG